jgi:DNA-binding transcriptional ArsR family regulator
MRRTPPIPLPGLVEPAKVAATRSALPAGEVARDAVEIFSALANPVRLSILHALAHDEMSVGDLARALELSLSVASHQLSILRRLKLVRGRDEGRLTFYRASDPKVSHLVHDCLEFVSERLGLPHRECLAAPPRKKARRPRGQ